MPTPSLLKIVFLLKGIEKGFSATTTQLKVENIILIDKSSFLSAGLISFFCFLFFWVLWHFYFRLRTHLYLMMQGGYEQQQQQQNNM